MGTLIQGYFTPSDRQHVTNAINTVGIPETIKRYNSQGADEVGIKALIKNILRKERNGLQE